MPRFGTAGVVLLAVGVLAMPGCGREKTTDSERVRVALVSNSPAGFSPIARRGAEQAAAEFDVDVEFHPLQNGTAAEQRTLVEGLVAKGIKAIAISPNDAANQADFLDEVADKIPLITHDSDLPSGSKRACYVGVDNYEVGRTAGQLVKEAMPEGGSVVVLTGQDDAHVALERRRGLRDELVGQHDKGLKSSQYVLADARADDIQQKECQTLVKDALAKYGSQPKRLCLVSLWACKTPAVLSAVKDAHLEGKVRLVGFDEDEETLQGVKDGVIYGAIVQQPFEFGYETVKIMARLAHGDHSILPETGVRILDHKVITGDNVDGFRAELNKRKQ